MGVLAKAIGSHPRASNIDFLAVGGPGLLPSLEIDKQYYLFSKDADINREVIKSEVEALSKYSAVIIYGCQLRATGGGGNWFKHIRKEACNYSSAFSNAVTVEFITNSVHYKFLHKNRSLISELRDTRFISMPCPKPNELMPIYSQWPLSSQMVQATDQKIRDTWDQLGVEFLDTPKLLETDQGLATKSKYKNKRPGDFSHLNIEGGELVMNDIASYLKL
jgi:hypothetical protein